MDDLQDLHDRLDAAIEDRDRLKEDASRIQGRLEAARAEQAAVEAECRAKNIEPDMLDAAIVQLKARLATGVAQAEAANAETKKAMAPFLSAGEGQS